MNQEMAKKIREAEEKEVKKREIKDLSIFSPLPFQAISNSV